MNRRLTLSASVIVIGGLALGLAAGCASKSMSKMGSGDVVADRQRLMKAVGANWADIQAKAKAGNIEGIAVNAETLALSAQHIPSMFPEGSGTEKSKAKPDIWQKWPEFEKAAKNLEAQSEKLRALGQMATGIAHDLNQSLMLVGDTGGHLALRP